MTIGASAVGMISYRPPFPSAPLAFVGKGITFDSGGIVSEAGNPVLSSREAGNPVLSSRDGPD